MERRRGVLVMLNDLILKLVWGIFGVRLERELKVYLI